MPRMRLRGCEAGFTLIEMIVVTAIIVIVAGTLGTFFLAGASPAVASANRDVTAAFDEARRTAIAFDAATVVFAPAQSGSGYSARIYQRFPGDPAFQPRNGPAYDSTVTISETASPLGAPGFAFSVDSHGTVTGFANFVAGQTTFTSRPCPPAGTFTLQLAYERDVRIVSIPCRLPLSSATPVAFETPPAAATATPFVAQTCPSTQTCTLAVVTPPPGGATCPPGYTADATTLGVCDLAGAPSPAPSSVTTPGSAPTCPPGDSGTFPNCVPIATVTPTPSGRCLAGASDPAGYATCLESNPVRATGPTVTHQSCGTHTPTTDPGPSFSIAVDVFRNGDLWAIYGVDIRTLKVPWLDFAESPPAQNCGLLYTLQFSIADVTALSGNAQTSPVADTGDAGLSDDGVGSIINPPVGTIWGSNT
jgi:prepilin-type N-terminal cleavage/methylation domain-containing protein